MKVAFGMKAHSGWAALVVVGKRDGDFVVVDRRRIEDIHERTLPARMRTGAAFLENSHDDTR